MDEHPVSMTQSDSVDTLPKEMAGCFLFLRNRAMKSVLSILLILCSIVASAQPWQPQVIWQREGQGDSCEYGHTILALGDQNDDGYADWAVFAWGKLGGSIDDSAYVEFLHGGNPPSTEPYFEIVQGPITNFMDQSESWGDLNGDGYQDWMVQRGYLGPPYSAIDYVYWGGPNSDSTPDLSFDVTASGWEGPLGDFNGDGNDDFYRYYLSFYDSTQIYFGGNPMDLMPDWVWRRSEGELAQVGLPFGVADFNNDGFSDFYSSKAETQPFSIYTHIFLGDANPDTVPAYTWNSDTSNAEGVAADLNGDGYDELIFAAAEGTLVCFGSDTLDPFPDVVLTDPCEGGITATVSLGDINHDGYQDLGVVDEYCDNAPWGMFLLYLGGPTLNPEPLWILEGYSSPLWLPGISGAAGLGDVNGDGMDDFAVAAISDHLTEGLRGKVVIFAGDSGLAITSRHPRLPSEFAVSVYPNPFNSVAVVELQLPVFTKHITLTLYNLMGQTVSEVTLQPTDTHLQYTLRAGDLPSGLYLLQADAGHWQQAKKLLLLK